MSRDAERGVVRVQITSKDGNTVHPFRASETVDDVRSFAITRLVQDKGQVSLDSTWIELGGDVVPGARMLSTLVSDGKNRGNELDLQLGLGWQSQGG